MFAVPMAAQQSIGIAFDGIVNDGAKGIKHHRGDGLLLPDQHVSSLMKRPVNDMAVLNSAIVYYQAYRPLAVGNAWRIGLINMEYHA